MKVTIYLIVISALLCIVYGIPVSNEKVLTNDAKDLNTAETVWDLFNYNGRGYSGWGTAPGSRGVPGAYPYSPYGGYGQQYYGARYPGYAGGYANGYPTYENYGLHGGHGFGKYGNY